MIAGNMDVISLKFDMSRGETYDFIGKKEIKLKTTNGMKMTYTMILAVLEDGIKLPQFLYLKVEILLL